MIDTISISSNPGIKCFGGRIIFTYDTTQKTCTELMLSRYGAANIKGVTC